MQRNSFRNALLLAWFVPLVFCAVLAAQTDRGAITGSVTDPAGAAVPAAKVTITDLATRVSVTVQTTGAGIYAFPQVTPAVYEVAAVATGFKKAVMKDVRVGVLQKLEINIAMEVGSVQDSITVSAEAPLLNPTSASISTNVSPREYQDLPIFFGGAFRSPLGLVNLLPGVNASKTAGVHISGSQSNSRDFQLDGVSVTMAEWQGDTRGFQLPVDTVQEFSVITNNFSAEFGRTGGGVESFTLKSGSNELHGSAYDYIRNEAFDARAFYAARRGIYKQHDLGTTVGGPVVLPKIYNGRNRTFFYFAFGAYRQANIGVNYLATVPSLKMRDGVFTEQLDAKGAPIPIYDPASTRSVNGVLTRDPFIGNTIPKIRFSKVAQAVQSYFPSPTRDGWFNNYDSYDKGTNRQTNFTYKVDHNIGSKHKIAGSMVMTYWPNIPTASLPEPVGGKRDTVMNSYVYRTTHDWVMTPTMVNHLALGFNRYLVQTKGENNGVDWYGQLGYTGASTGNLWGFPGFTVSGVGAFGGGGGFGTFDNTYNVLDSFSWQKGKHSIKAGFEARRIQNNSRNPGNGPSSVITQGATALPNAASQSSTGIGWASFLLGEVYQTGFFVNDVTNGPRWGQYMSYVQDDWKVTPRLTLNIGLRWEVPRPFYDVNLVNSTVDMTKPNPAAGNLPGTLIFAKDWYKQTGQKSFMDTSWHEFGPRFGLAYRMRSDTVIRLAYGIFYNAGFGLGNGFRGSTAGYSTNVTEAAPNVWETRWNLDKPFVVNFQMPPFTDASFGVDTSTSLSAITRDLGKSAYIQSWNAGFQKQLKWNFVFEADYVGNKGTRLPSLRFSGKQLQPWYWGLGDLLTKNIRDPAVAAAGYAPPYPTFRSTILAQALAMLPQYGRFTPNVADGMSNYHSAQLKLQRRFDAGFSFLGSYTLGKMMTDTNSQLLRPAYGSVTARDSYNKAVDKAISPDDRTHVVSISFLYELPFGPGKPLLKQTNALRYLVGGWQINGVLSYASGFPLTISGNYNLIPDGGVGANRTVTPDAVTGVARGMTQSGEWQPGVSVYADRAAWSQVSGYRIGTAPYILPNLRGFASRNENLAVFKSFEFRERWRFQIKAEAANVLNRFIPGDPNMAWNPSNAQWGRTYSQGNGPRVLQMGGKLTF